MFAPCVWDLLSVRYPYKETSARGKAYPFESALTGEILIAAKAGGSIIEVFVLPEHAERVSLHIMPEQDAGSEQRTQIF